MTSGSGAIITVTAMQTWNKLRNDVGFRSTQYIHGRCRHGTNYVMTSGSGAISTVTAMQTWNKLRNDVGFRSNQYSHGDADMEQIT